MSLRLLIDEDTQNRLLVHLLRASGHDVLTINEVALMGEPDPVILDFASAARQKFWPTKSRLHAASSRGEL